MENLEREIGSLSTVEKIELIDALWESLEAEVSAITEEQRVELDYRMARYENSPTNVVSWERISADLLKGR